MSADNKLAAYLLDIHYPYTAWRIKEFLQQGANVNACVGEHQRPLLWYLVDRVSRHHSKEIMHVLLDANPDVIGQPPLLLYMADQGFKYGVKRIISMGAPIFDVDENGDCALHLFIRYVCGDDTVRAFVEKDASITLVRNKAGRPRDEADSNSEPIDMIETILYDAEKRAEIQIMTLLSDVISVSALTFIIFDYL